MALVQPLGLVSDQNTKFEPLVGLVDSKFVKRLPPICYLLYLTAWVYMPYNVKKILPTLPPYSRPQTTQIGAAGAAPKGAPSGGPPKYQIRAILAARTGIWVSA